VQPIEYFRIIRRRWPIIVVLTLIGLVAGYVTARPASPSSPTVSTPSAVSYQATATYELSSSTTDASGYDLDTMAYFATTEPVLAATAKSLSDKAGASGVASEVQVKAQENLGLLDISASEPSAAYAASVANTLGGQLITFVDGQILQTYEVSLKSADRQLTAWSKLIAQYQREPSSSLVQLELSQAQTAEDQQAIAYQQLLVTGPGHTSLQEIEPATASTAAFVGGGGGSTGVPIPSNRKSRLALGGFAGFLVGLGLALVWERFDTSIRSREQAETVLGLPVLGEVPGVSASRGRRGLVVLDDPVSASAEAYRMFQTTLALSSPEGQPDGHPAVVLLSSPGRLKGKEYVVANLAASFSEAGNSVTIVAADSFDPSLPALVRRSQRGSARRDEKTAGPAAGASTPVASTASATVIDGVSLLMNGLRPTIGNGQAQKHAELVSAGRSLADVVLIDTPPVLLAHDAGRLSPVADSVVLMCEIGGVKAAEARLAVDRLRRVGAPLTGVVLVGRDGPAAEARLVVNRLRRVGATLKRVELVVRGRPKAKARGVLRAGGGQHARGGARSIAPGETELNAAKDTSTKTNPHSPSTSVQ
jgi:capsular polysaccharide biosynthesis protein/Mrp family chromosome partitioning ATPase